MLPTRFQLQTRIPTTDVANLLQRKDASVIDLRSPSEFAADHLPGAVNVPLFDDRERALIGTLYKQSSPEEAWNEGGQIARSKITEMVKEISAACRWGLGERELEQKIDQVTSLGFEGVSRTLTTEPRRDLGSRPVVLHCWRGGLRSRCVVAFFRGLGFERAMGLEGGYKAYRKHVGDELARWTLPAAVRGTFVLRGLTGVGKTLVLREIEQLRPGWTVDLEDLAQHRSSLLGMVGLEPRSQKSFESVMLERLGQISGGVVFEGESRKVGDAVIPVRMWSSMQAGVNLELVASVEHRVRVLENDYLANAQSREQLRNQLLVVEDRMKLSVPKGTLCELLDTGRVPELVEILLGRYYDPLYRHSEGGRCYEASFEVRDAARTAREVVRWIEAR